MFAAISITPPSPPEFEAFLDLERQNTSVYYIRVKSETFHQSYSNISEYAVSVSDGRVLSMSTSRTENPLQIRTTAMIELSVGTEDDGKSFTAQITYTADGVTGQKSSNPSVLDFAALFHSMFQSLQFLVDRERVP